MARERVSKKGKEEGREERGREKPRLEDCSLVLSLRAK